MGVSLALKAGRRLGTSADLGGSTHAPLGGLDWVLLVTC